MRRATALALGLLCTASPLLAQTIVPVEQEPVHTVVFENALVRVIDAALPVGHATLYHTHSRDNVPVAVAGGRVATIVLGREAVESTVKTGQVSFAAGGYTHIVRNVGPTPLHFIDVELLTSAPAAAPAPATTAAAPLVGHVQELQQRARRGAPRGCGARPASRVAQARGGGARGAGRRRDRGAWRRRPCR